MTMKKTAMVLLVLVISGLAFAQQGDRELFTEAERRFQSQDYELAIDRYDTLIRQYPVSQYIPDSQFRKAVSLYRIGSLPEALALLDTVARRYRSTRFLGYVPFWRGVVNYDLGETRAALEALTRFVEVAQADSLVDPDLVNQAYLYKALSEIETGDPTSAGASLRSLLSDEDDVTDQPYALSLLLSLEVQAGRFEEAGTLYDSVERDRLDPAYRAQIDLYGAEARNGVGDIEAAVALYRSLTSTTPQVVTVAYQRLFQYAQAGLIGETQADVLRQAEQALAGQTEILKELWLRVGIDSFNQERFDLAELYFRRIWDFRGAEPIPASVPLYLSRLLDRRGDLNGAASVLNDYLDLYEDTTDERLRVLIALGNFQIRTGEFDDAARTLELAITGYPESEYFGEASYQYAFALRRLGRGNEALEVIEAAFVSGRTSGVQANLTRLRGRILREAGRESEAVQALLEYLPLRPDDASAAVEYINLLVSLEEYGRVLDEGPTVLEELASRGVAGPPQIIQIEYAIGLSLVTEKEYDRAARSFTAALEQRVDSQSVAAGLLPYARYYRGWSRYRLGEYAVAAQDFETLIEEDPAHRFAARASYLAGWAYFRLGQFDRATSSLARVRSYAVDEELATEASFLLGRSLAANQSLQQAQAEFRSLYLDYPSSVYADDAWFEYAQVQAGLGNTVGAVAALDELLVRYPSSELAQTSVFRRAELLFGAGDFTAARDAYFDYRTRYPQGEQIDAALYWGGQASAELGETAGAILLWERLVTERRSSPYRADAMLNAAVLHAERDEYRQALNLYTELEATYPEVARSIGAQRRIDELVLIINGLSERDAELYVTIEQAGGATTDRGRQAIIELSRLAIYEDTATGIDAGTVIPLLESVANNASRAPAYAAQALFLLGEYHSRQEEFLQAAERYLESAATSASDRDLAALAIYRAAQMYSTAGRSQETQILLARLEEDFPGSQWLEEARKLLGGAR